jgi:hypothetical protein
VVEAKEMVEEDRVVTKYLVEAEYVVAVGSVAKEV